MNLPRTLGQLRQSAFSEPRLNRRRVKDELRENLIARLRQGETLFPGIVGYAMAMPDIVLMKHAQLFHHFAGKKFPPARKQQSCILCFISHLGNSAPAGSDVSVMSIQNENFAKSEMHNISKNVRQVHGHNLRTDRDRAQEMRRVRRALREIDGGKE